jgi:DNA-binding transcriptional LysR family regulator
MLNRLEYLKIFCIAAEHRTFRDAAMALNVSPQVVSRCIRDLESELGEILFVRSTRNIKITSYGETLYADAKNAIATLDEVFQKRTQTDSLAVKITAPPILSQRFIMPLLDKITQDNPSIRFDLRLSDSISNVVEDQIDIGIRVGLNITDTRFIARPVAAIDHVVVGTPALIARYGTPSVPDDLNRVPTTSLIDQTRNRTWPWFFKDNLKFSPESPIFISDNAESEFLAVLQGMGFGQIAVALAAPLIQSGQLVPVLESYAMTESWNLFIYRPQNGPVPPRTRIVYDTFVTHFSDQTFFPTHYHRRQGQ